MTAIDRLYGSIDNLNRVLDDQPSAGLPTWTGKPRDASITEWGVERLWNDNHGRHDNGNLADPADEQLAILAALDGDDEARLSLLRAYLPGIKHIVGRHSASSLENEDVRQTAVIGLLEAIQAFDPAKHDRLEPLLQRRVQDALSESYGNAFTARVPARTRRRYSQIVRAAGGDIAVAETRAPEYGMTRRVFREVHQALTAYEVEEPTTLLPETAVVDEALDAAELADAMMRADMSARERAAIVLAFGLGGQDPMTDGQVGEALGVSRSRAAHIKADAITKMRSCVSEGN